MTSQLQVLNKILQEKDFSLVTLNNLTEDYFFNYRSEFKYIRDHYEKYNSVPDRLTFVDLFGDFDLVDVSEPDSYLIEQLFKDYNSAFLAARFNDIRQHLERDDVAGAMPKNLCCFPFFNRTNSCANRHNCGFIGFSG